MPLEPHGAPEAAAWLRLAFTPGVSRRLQRSLLAEFGSPGSVLRAAREDARLAETDEGVALRGVEAEPAVERALRWLEEPRRHLVVLGDARYPARLLETGDPPTVLFARGEPRFLLAPSIAIVGSRNASPLGLRDAESLALAFSDAGLCVVSGLARGIDASAHRGGLRGPGSTVAVMGTGCDRIYPAAHIELAREIEDKGCLVTEFPLGTKENRWNFPRRNRLISGLSLGVLVVEAGMKSGSLITAQCSLDQGREVFAVPGSIHSALSKGCHHLIREGAKLVERAQDVMEEIGWKHDPPSPDEGSLDTQPPDPVLDAVPYAPTSLDDLAEWTGLAIPALAASLSRLEIEGRIVSLPGGRFSRLDKGPR